MTILPSALAAAGKTFRTDGVSRRAAQITISAIKEMPLLASRVGGCVSLGQGIPSFPTPPHIVEAVCDALKSQAWSGKYSLQPGLPELRKAIAETMAVEKGVHADPASEIVVTVGAMEGLVASILTLIERGDEVLLPSPTYASHIEQVLLAEGVPVFVPLKETDWSLDVAAFERAVTPRTKAIVLCNPHNPTGAVFPEEDLRALADLAVRKNLFFIADETYDFLTFDGCRHFSLAALAQEKPAFKDRFVGAYSFSKKFAMTGWRVGWLHAPEWIMDQVMKIHDAAAICAPTVSQIAALAALTGPQDCVAEIHAALERRRDLICRRMDAMGGFFRFVKPRGAYYVMARYDAPGISAMDMALRLLNEAKVISVPGSAFGPGGEGCVRFSFGGAEAEIEEAMDRIERWRLKGL